MQGWKTLPGSTNDVDVPHHSRVKNSTAVSKEKAFAERIRNAISDQRLLRSGVDRAATIGVIFRN